MAHLIPAISMKVGRSGDHHISTAGTYAHTVNCDWYSDAEMSASAVLNVCKGIATQLISNVDTDVNSKNEEGGLD